MTSRQCVYIGYGGRWNENLQYVDHQTHIIFADIGMTHKAFLEKICARISLNQEADEPTIWFDTKTTGAKGMLVACDEDLEVCLQLVKTKEEYEKAHFNVEVKKPVNILRPDLSEARKVCFAGNLNVEINGEENASFMSNEEYIPDYGDVQSVKPNRRKRKAEEVEFIRGYERRDDVKVNYVFESKEKLKRFMEHVAISKHFQFRVKKSNGSQFVLNCYVEKCKWRLNAFRVNDSSFFKVNKYNDMHTCSIDMKSFTQRHATANFISELLKEKFYRKLSKLTPADVCNEMLVTYGVTISYKVARSALELSRESIRGSPEHQYMMLPSYLEMMKLQNPGTHTDIQWGDDQRFKYAFFAYSASIHGWKFCRPVIVIDATFLKGKYKGVMMVAVSKDGNNNIFPLAFGIADVENSPAWEWFMIRVKRAFGSPKGLAILSDRHVSIQDAVSKVYPESFHGICAYHLEQNLRGKYKNNTAIGLYNVAARVYKKADFRKLMGEIERIHPKMASYLLAEPVERWTRSHAPCLRYNMLTTNIVESMNATLRFAREKPVLDLMDEIQELLQMWFFKRKFDADCTFHKVTTWAAKEIEDRIDSASRMHVLPSNGNLYKVMEAATTFLVNLKDRRCTCLVFDLDGIPCSHAIAAIHKIALNVSDFCCPFFSKGNLVKTYEGQVLPVGDTKDWTVMNEVKQLVTKPPKVDVQRGRRKKRRHPSILEHIRTVMKCTVCNRKGHTGSRCIVSRVRLNAYSKRVQI